MPIINPVSGLQYGQLKVTLAMGSLEQISSYQRTKAGSTSGFAVVERPASYLERCLVFLPSFVSHIKISTFVSCFHHATDACYVLSFIRKSSLKLLKLLVLYKSFSLSICI